MKDNFLTVVTFLWDDPERDKTHSYKFGPEHVVILRNMVKRNLTIPHEFVCVTDTPFEVHGIRIVDLDKTKHVSGTVFARLMMRKPDIAATLGRRILSLDLDCVVVGSLDDIAGRTEDAVFWHNPNFGLPRRAFYQTSIQLFDAGARSQLWTHFDPETSVPLANRRFGGAEQAWVSEMLDWDEANFDAEFDGVYGAARGTGIGVREALPDNAKIVFFPGNRIPSQPETQAEYPWVGEFYK